MAAVETEAFVTLATNDAYSIGCLTLGRSLRRVRTTRKLVVMVTSGVTPAMRNQLHQVFDVVETVNLLDSQDPINLQLLGRPDLNVTFTKLHCWCLTQFTKCVFLDADTLVLQNVDELFDREELSAAPDAGWPDCFNSGVFVFRPSLETYQSLLDFAVSQGSFDGGDQGLLNSYFSDWATRDISKHLPFIYNVVSQAFYSYLPAFTKFKDSVKIVHFIGAVKPWNHTYNTVTRTVTPLPGTGHSDTFLQLWWTIFMEDIQATLDPQLNPYLTLEQSTDFDAYHPSYSSYQTAGVSCPPSGRAPMDSYFVVYPFVPPKLEMVFYTPSVTSSTNTAFSPLHGMGDTSSSADIVIEQSDNKLARGADVAGTSSEETFDQPKVIEIREAESQRPYLHLETHYSEDPLTSITPENPAPELYSAEEFERLADRQSHPPSEDTKELTEKESADNMHDILQIANQSLLALFGLENQTDSGAVITGGMGTLQIASSAGSGAFVELNDLERKLAWEKGQIDYLGRDSFANIQRKLDATIHAGASEPVVQASQAPFPRVSPTAESNATDAGSGKAVSAISISPSSKPPPSATVPQPKAVKTSIKLTPKAAAP